MKKTILTVALASALAVSVPMIAYADGGYGGGCSKGEMRGGHQGGGWGKHGGWGKRGGSAEARLERMADKLDLSAEQKTQVEAIFANYKDTFETHRESMQDLRQQMRDLDRTQPEFLQNLEPLAEQKAQLMKQQILDRATMGAEIDAVLTDEQRAQKNEWMEKRFKRFKG